MALFRRVVRYHPAPGKINELRSALLAEPRQGRGNINERLAGPCPEIRLVREYDSLAALEQELAAAASRPMGALAPLLAAAPAFELNEQVAAPPAGPGAGVLSVSTYEFAPGRGAEVRTLLEAQVARRNAAGDRFGINVRVTGGAAAYSLVRVYPDLAALEKSRAAILADSANADWLRQVGALLTHSADLPDVYRVLHRFGF